MPHLFDKGHKHREIWAHSQGNETDRVQRPLPQLIVVRVQQADQGMQDRGAIPCRSQVEACRAERCENGSTAFHPCQCALSAHIAGSKGNCSRSAHAAG